MNVDPDELRTVRRRRVEADPLVSIRADHGEETLSFKPGDEPSDAVVQAREAAIEDGRHPADKPITTVTWAELNMTLQEWSLNSSVITMSPKLYGVNIYAFQQYMDQIGIQQPDLGIGDMGPLEMLNSSVATERFDQLAEPIPQSEIESLTDEFRRMLAHAQNRIFYQRTRRIPRGLTSGMKPTRRDTNH